MRRLRHRFDHLLPATWYTFAASVIGENGVQSEQVTINVVTNPSDLPIPLVSRYNSREMAIKFVRDSFPYLNGEIVNYAVLVGNAQAVSSR
jgi:hypothetical protein